MNEYEHSPCDEMYGDWSTRWHVVGRSFITSIGNKYAAIVPSHRRTSAVPASHGEPIDHIITTDGHIDIYHLKTSRQSIFDTKIYRIVGMEQEQDTTNWWI